MTRRFRMALGLAALAVISGEVEAQELRPVDGRQVIVSRPTVEHVVPAQTFVSSPSAIRAVRPAGGHALIPGPGPDGRIQPAEFGDPRRDDPGG